jgi:hypothetical protein
MSALMNPTEELAVAEACSSMGWFADRREWDRLEMLFTDQVRVDYTSLAGGEPVLIDRCELASSWSRTLGALSATQHLIAGQIVRVDGDSATSEANFQATHLGFLDGHNSMWTLGGHYRFELSRLLGEWRIAAVTMTAVWETGDRALLGADGAR